MSKEKVAVAVETVESVKVEKKAPKKKVKKLTPSNAAKKHVNEMIAEMLESHDIEILDGRNDGYGMTEYTIIARLEESDVQIKLITPALKFKGRYMPVEE